MKRTTSTRFAQYCGVGFGLAALASALCGTIGLTVSARPAQAQASTQPMFELPSEGNGNGSSVPFRTEGSSPAPLSDEGPRVVGGRPTTHDAWPSYVQVRVNGRFCGGTVIAPQWVMTAGHCGVLGSAENFMITEEIDKATQKGHQIAVSEVIVHERYSAQHHNDIALLHLRSPARSAPQTLMGARAEASQVAPGTTAWVAGFGLTSPQPMQGANSGGLSDDLREVDLPVVDEATCRRILGPYYNGQITDAIDASTLCAGNTQGGKDSCQGDSGGPLAINVSERRPIQIGVVSWGPGCALRGTVGVYTSVAHFEGWIKQRVPEARFYEAATSTVTPGPTPAPSNSVAAVEQLANALGRQGDIRVEIIEGNRPRVGNRVHFRVVSSIAGQLLVYNVDLALGNAYQVFPNQYSRSSAATGSQFRIAAGGDVTVPGAGDTFAIKVKEPAGQNRLYAFILPPNINIGDIARRGMDMHDLADPSQVFAELARRGLRGLEAVSDRADRGAAVYEYEIVR